MGSPHHGTGHGCCISVTLGIGRRILEQFVQKTMYEPLGNSALCSVSEF